MVETSNKMEGVPFADCFTVDTKWRITEQSDECRIQVWVKVNFTKSVSLVKGKIERNSVQGTQDYFKAYAEMLRARFSGGAEGDSSVPKASAPSSSSGTASGRSDLSPILAITLGIGCALFFVLWLWYWWSAGSWATYVGELEARNLELEHLVSQLQNQPPPPPADVQETIQGWHERLTTAGDILEKLKAEISSLSK